MQAIPKLKLVVSDFHLGTGKRLADGFLNPQEDFHHDQKFIEFLDYYSHTDYATADIELIVNGDFFNMLALMQGEQDPSYVTEEKSLAKLDAIVKGHPRVFEAMSRFCSAFRHRIVFVVGNHEPGLLFEAVKVQVKKMLGGDIKFVDRVYYVDHMHIEHGNQYFADNRYNTEHYFLTDGVSSPIVNLPWGSHFLIHFLYPMKRERWYIDKVYPFKLYLRWALTNDTRFALKLIAKIVLFFITYRFWHHPHRRSPFRNTLQILKEVTLSPRLHREAKRILFSHKDCRAVIFGHTHVAQHLQFAPNKEYLNTGTWNEGISLDIGGTGRKTKLTFVLVEYPTPDGPYFSLKEWKGSHHLIEDAY